MQTAVAVAAVVVAVAERAAVAAGRAVVGRCNSGYHLHRRSTVHRALPCKMINKLIQLVKAGFSYVGWEQDWEQQHCQAPASLAM